MLSQTFGKELDFVAHIDSSIPAARSIYKPDLEIIGNNEAILTDLVTRFKPVKKNHNDLDSMKIIAEEPEDIDHDFPVDPRKILHTLEGELSESDIIVSDVGFHKQYVGLNYPSNKPNTTIFSNGLSAMGFALPAAMAAALIHSDKKIVVISGDGGFQMNIQELATIVENNLNITIIIMNDGALGMVKKKQMETVGDHYAAEFKNSPKFSEIAKAYGCEGYEVGNIQELESSIKSAVHSERSAVIDVPIKQYINIKAMK